MNPLRALIRAGLVEEPAAAAAIWWFLRGLALVFLIAIVSFWVLIEGLVGDRGILPAADFLTAVERQLGGARWYLLPTLSWWAPGTAALHAMCAAGVVLSLLLLLNLAPAPALAGLWAIYLSLSTAGQDFYQFQWDVLLLETALLACFVAPWKIAPGWRSAPAPPRLALWALWLLLAKLMIQSGVVKLTSGDPAWLDLTALTYHYETQPLPLATSWYAHHFPLWWQRFSCGATYAIEIGAPLLILVGARARQVSFAALFGLQVLIAASGNYAFFNLLTAVLCVPLLPARHFPARLRRWLRAATAPAGWPELTRFALFVPAGLTILLLLPGQGRDCLPRPRNAFPLLDALGNAVAPFRSCNSYGLFRVMTKERNEIVLEGSLDGNKWLSYELPFQPGDVARSPRLVAPYQPRLDWQMWFAALGRIQQNPWLAHVIERLLEAEPAVLALFAKDPFAGERPRFIRAALFRYRFTTAEQRQATGEWWSREFVGYYVQPVSRPR